MPEQSQAQQFHRSTKALRGLLAGLLSILGFCHATHAASDPKEIEIGVIPEALEFDRQEFRVVTAQEVILHFRNNGIMPHNLLIVPPGESRTVAMAAIKMGEEGKARDFVPDSPLVLHATRLLDPDEEQTLRFTAPDKPGDYDYVCTFPGHGFTMTGVMRVVPPNDITNQGSDDPAAKESESQSEGAHVIQPEEHPVFFRGFIPPSTPGGIVVGFPNGISYGFDAAECSLALAWQEGFVDMSPAWSGRGGSPLKILGETFYRGNDICPIRINSPAKQPDVQFLGYDILDNVPVLRYRVEGVLVTERITPASSGTGIVRSFEVAATDAPIWYRIADNPELKISTTAGSIVGDRIKVAPHGPIQFQIAISKR